MVAEIAPDVAALRPVRATTRRSYASFEGSCTRKLRAIGAELTPEVLEEGAAWYPSVAASLEQWGADYGQSLESCAIVLALLSPRCKWHLNVAAAREVLDGFAIGERPRPWGPLPENVDRAYRFLEGAAPFSDDPLGALKTRSFAANCAGLEGFVTVDVWAARAVGVNADTMTAHAYCAIARAYQRVARELDVSPAAFQAAVWVHIRGTGA